MAQKRQKREKLLILLLWLSGLCKFLAAAHMQLQFFLSLPLIKLEPLLSLPLAHFTHNQPGSDNYTTHTHMSGDRIGLDRIRSDRVWFGLAL